MLLVRSSPQSGPGSWRTFNVDSHPKPYRAAVNGCRPIAADSDHALSLFVASGTDARKDDGIYDTTTLIDLKQ
jgi:hypothetical protein